MRFQFFLLLALAVSISSCDKDPSIEATLNPPTVLSGEIVTANFYGHLTNDHGEAVPDAAVRIGNKQTTTDQEGLWSIENASVIEDQAFIQFDAADHHKGSRTLLVTDGNRFEVDVQMLKFTGAITIDATTGGTGIVAGTDASVTFPGGAFAKTDGTAYTGNVRVEAAYLDPNDLSIGDQMPGDLRATTAAGESRLLITYGMITVELFDDAGNELQLAEGQTATISLPVNGEAANTAPASIPLWYFDDATAQWIEEGQATLQDGSYIGEVSHFTFWNCDIPTEYMRLCGTVVFEGKDSTVAANLRLSIVSQNWGTAYGYTDENGQFCGIVPANETLNFIVSGVCGVPVYSVTIGPYASDTDLGTIIVPLPQNTLANVSGTVICNGDILTSGAVRIAQNGRTIAITAVKPDGSFSTDYISCDTSIITVNATNYTTREKSNDLIFPYTNNIATGDIEACSQVIESYFELIIDGNSQLGDTAYLIRTGSSFTIRGDGFSSSDDFEFSYFKYFDDFPDPLVVGTTSLSLSPTFASLYVESENLPYTFAIWYTSVDLTISSVATPTDPYVVGQIGPFVETIEDPRTGAETDYTIQVNFSAYTQL